MRPKIPVMQPMIDPSVWQSSVSRGSSALGAGWYARGTACERTFRSYDGPGPSDRLGGEGVTQPATPDGGTPARLLLALVIPGIIVGTASALLLIALTVVSNQLEDVLWDWLPATVGVG